MVMSTIMPDVVHESLWDAVADDMAEENPQFKDCSGFYCDWALYASLRIHRETRTFKFRIREADEEEGKTFLILSQEGRTEGVI